MPLDDDQNDNGGFQIDILGDAEADADGEIRPWRPRLSTGTSLEGDSQPPPDQQLLLSGGGAAASRAKGAGKFQQQQEPIREGERDPHDRFAGFRIPIGSSG